MGEFTGAGPGDDGNQIGGGSQVQRLEMGTPQRD